MEFVLELVGFICFWIIAVAACKAAGNIAIEEEDVDRENLTMCVLGLILAVIGLFML